MSPTLIVITSILGLVAIAACLEAFIKRQNHRPLSKIGEQAQTDTPDVRNLPDTGTALAPRQQDATLTDAQKARHKTQELEDYAKIFVPETAKDK